MEDPGTIIDDIHATLARHAPGGMVGAFVIAAELYGNDGEPQLFTAHSSDGTSWTHLGIIEALRVDSEVQFRRGAGGGA